MAVNLLTLIQAFYDGSKQDEKMQTSYTDKFITDTYLLSEQNFNISMNSIPPMPESIGKFSVY